MADQARSANVSHPPHIAAGHSDFVGDQVAAWLRTVVARVMPSPLKSVIGLILNLVAVVYCFGLDYYFIHNCGSLQEAENQGLGPTVWGLAIVGLLFCIPVLLKLVLVFIELRKPRLGGGAGGSSPGGDDKFDADAVVARYLAAGQSETVSSSPGSTRLVGGGGSAKRPGFGRRNA